MREAENYETKAKKIREQLTWTPSDKLPNESRIDSIRRRVNLTGTFNQLRLTYSKICQDFHSEVDSLKNANYILQACSSANFPKGILNPIIFKALLQVAV